MTLANTFTHLSFWQNPIQTSAFFSILMALLSIWVRKTAWLWGSFLFISLLCALDAGVIHPIAILPLALLAILFWGLQYDIQGLGRFLLVSVAILISGGLFFHFLPGFHNWNLVNQMTVSPGGIPYNLWLNYDKPFVGLFILIWLLPTLENRNEWKQTLKQLIPLLIIGVALLMSLSFFFHLITWDPKLPAFLLPWLLANLFFTVIPEEALLRGFIQQELFHWLGEGIGAHVGCVVISSALFTLFHVNWVGNLSFLLLVFVAGLIYGSIYQITQKIESSILCHFAVNACHLLFFTYPALSTAF